MAMLTLSLGGAVCFKEGIAIHNTFVSLGFIHHQWFCYCLGFLGSLRFLVFLVFLGAVVLSEIAVYTASIRPIAYIINPKS